VGAVDRDHGVSPRAAVAKTAPLASHVDVQKVAPARLKVIAPRLEPPVAIAIAFAAPGTNPYPRKATWPCGGAGLVVDAVLTVPGL